VSVALRARAPSLLHKNERLGMDVSESQEDSFLLSKEEINKLLDAYAALPFEYTEGTQAENEQFPTLILDKPNSGTTKCMKCFIHT